MVKTDQHTIIEQIDTFAVKGIKRPKDYVMQMVVVFDMNEKFVIDLCVRLMLITLFQVRYGHFGHSTHCNV